MLLFCFGARQKLHKARGEFGHRPMEEERLHPGLKVFESENKGRG